MADTTTAAPGMTEESEREARFGERWRARALAAEAELERLRPVVAAARSLRPPQDSGVPFLVRGVYATLEALDDADKGKATSEGVNPRDCNCSYTHASSASCRSVEVSRGAVPESQRMFPATTNL